MTAIVEKILKDGVSSLRTDMLPQDVRRLLLGDAGNTLAHRGRLKAAAEAYTVGGCVEQLRETAAWLLERHRYADAAMFLRSVGRPDELRALAEDCVAAGETSAAAALYAELGDGQMVAFLGENFPGR